MAVDPDRPLTLDVTMISEVELDPVASVRADDLVALSGFVLEAERMSGPWSVVFVLVDDARLQRFHLDFMGIDAPTDVMTFEAGAGDGEPGRPARGGDIIISVDRAVDQAASNENAPDRELLFVAVHGLLHLTGWVDHSDAERAAMLARGDDLLRRFEARQMA